MKKFLFASLLLSAILSLSACSSNSLLMEEQKSVSKNLVVNEEEHNPQEVLPEKLEILEMKHFSEISGFVFDYPIFKGWEIERIETKTENEYVIWFTWPDKNILLAIPPHMKIKKMEAGENLEFERVTELQETKNGVEYEYVYLPSNHGEGYDPKGYWDGVHFFTENPSNGVLIEINTGEQKRDMMMKNIIETFEFK